MLLEYLSTLSDGSGDDPQHFNVTVIALRHDRLQLIQIFRTQSDRSRCKSWCDKLVHVGSPLDRSHGIIQSLVVRIILFCPFIPEHVNWNLIRRRADAYGSCEFPLGW